MNILLFLQSGTLDQVKGYLPKFEVGNFGIILTIFFIIVFLLICFGVGLYFFMRHLKFNKHVTIWEDVEGHDDLEPVGKDKAMLIKVGRGGTELLYLKKRKVYRGSYGKRIGAKQYFFVIGKDGYWYNSTLGSLDSAMKKIAIKPTNVNMRYQNESLQELIKDRYEKPSFWAQYGQIIVNLIFFMLVAVMFWMYFSSFKEVAPTLIQASEALKEASQAIGQAVGGLDALKGSGGFNPA